MTQDTEKPMTPENDVPNEIEQPAADFVLQSIVDLVNTTGIEFGITLCVGGIVISGQLTSGKKFFEAIANDALEASGPADQDVVRRAFSDYLGNFGKQIYGQDQIEDQSDNEVVETVKQLPAYIHLRDAKFFHNSGNPIPTNHGLWWRGRITVVDGFSFGAFGQQRHN